MKQQLEQMLTRLELSEEQGADYLGVPVHTFKKWLTGQRKPSASAIRLVEVLATIEALSPALNNNFLKKVTVNVNVKGSS